MAGTESNEVSLLEDLVSLAIDLRELCEPVIYDFDNDRVVEIGKVIRAKALSIQAHAQSYRAPPRIAGPVPADCTGGVTDVAGEVVELSARLVFDFDNPAVVQAGYQVREKALEVIGRVRSYSPTKKTKARVGREL